MAWNIDKFREKNIEMKLNDVDYIWLPTESLVTAKKHESISIV